MTSLTMDDSMMDSLSLYANSKVKPGAKSPVKVETVPAWQADMVAAMTLIDCCGPGLIGGVVNQPAIFTVESNVEDGEDLGFSVDGPAQAKIDIEDNGNLSAKITYWPTMPGEYAVHILCRKKDIPKSPYMVQILPATTDLDADNVEICTAGQTKIVAHGPGLIGGVVNQPAIFTVDSKGENGSLGFSIKGPSQAKMDIKDNGDGSAKITYWPTMPGEYAVHILCRKKDIPKSPYMAQIRPATADVVADKVADLAKSIPHKPIKVKVESSSDVSGIRVKGLESRVFIEAPTEITVDARSVTPSGEGKVKAILTTPSGKKVQTLVNNKKDGTYPVLFTPLEQGPHQLDVTYEGVPLPGSPFKVNAVPGNDASKVRAYGPGLESGMTKTPAIFTVDMKGAGKGDLGLGIEGPAEAKMNCKDNRDGTCQVQYVPTKPGDYDIAVNFANKPIPGSPFRVRVRDPVDAGKVQCFGAVLDSNGVTVANARDQNGSPTVFHANSVNGHSGNIGFDNVSYGLAKSDDVTALGPGLSHGTVHEPAFFTINIPVGSRGRGSLSLVAEGPSHAEIKREDNVDGTVTASYVPTVPGEYLIIVQFADKDVVGSPFTAKITRSIKREPVSTH